MHMDKYFINNKGLLHKYVKGDDKLFDVLVAPITLCKYILHQAHNALGHNGTVRTY